MKLRKLRLEDKRIKGEFIEVVRKVVVFEEFGRPPWLLVRYIGSRPKTQFANYILDNTQKIRERARANKESIPSKNLVFELEYPPGREEKRLYIIKMPDYGIFESKRITEKKARGIEHEFYSNVYLYELLEYPLELGFGPGQKIVPLPSCLLFNEKTGETIFTRNSVINTPLSIIAGDRVSDVVAENTAINTATALALFTRLGIHHDLHFANIGVDFSSNRCSVVFFDLENFTPLKEIRKKDLPGKIFQSVASAVFVLMGVGIISRSEHVKMFKEKYIELNEEWIREQNPRIFDAVMEEKSLPSSDTEIALYRMRCELRFRNLANPAFWSRKQIEKRVSVSLYLLWNAIKMLVAGRL